MSGQKINIPMLGIFLGVVAAFSAGLLSLVYTSTADAIALNLQKKTNKALEQVLPPFDNVPADETVVIRSELDWPVKFYIARKDGDIVGFAGEVISPEGFSGDITVMAGLELDATIRTVIVTANTETPGLGTVIADRKMQKTIIDVVKGNRIEGLVPNHWLDQYARRKAGANAWKVQKDGGDIDAKTGATITSRAVCGAVYAVAQTAAENLDALAKGVE